MNGMDRAAGFASTLRHCGRLGGQKTQASLAQRPANPPVRRSDPRNGQGLCPPPILPQSLSPCPALGRSRALAEPIRELLQGAAGVFLRLQSALVGFGRGVRLWAVRFWRDLRRLF